jgi:hypothetical protein
MGNENDKQPMRKYSVFQRIVAVVLLLVCIAAAIWRFVWPFTGVTADLIFIGVLVAGFVAAKAVKII